MSYTDAEFKEAMDWATFCYRATPHLCNAFLSSIEEAMNARKDEQPIHFGRVRRHGGNDHICALLPHFDRSFLHAALTMVPELRESCPSLTLDNFTAKRGQELLDAGAVQPRYHDIHTALTATLGAETAEKQDVIAFLEAV